MYEKGLQLYFLMQYPHGNSALPAKVVCPFAALVLLKFPLYFPCDKGALYYLLKLGTWLRFFVRNFSYFPFEALFSVRTGEYSLPHLKLTNLTLNICSFRAFVIRLEHG